jgi:hypothetical protein
MKRIRERYAKKWLTGSTLGLDAGGVKAKPTLEWRAGGPAIPRRPDRK